MRYLGFLLLGIAGYFVIGYTLAVLGIVGLPLFTLQSKVATNYGIIEKTYNADNAVYNYEWFKSTYEAIGALENKIKNAQTEVDNFVTSAGDRKDWTFEDKTEEARLKSVVLGLKNQREDLVANYNARAKMVNRSVFQDKLPLFISL